MALSNYERWFRYMDLVIADIEKRIASAQKGHNKKLKSDLLNVLNECRNAYNSNMAVLQKFKLPRAQYNEEAEKKIFQKCFRKKIQGASEKWDGDNPDTQEILQQRAIGKSLQQIANKKGMSKSQVQKVIEKHKKSKWKTNIAVYEDDKQYADQCELKHRAALTKKTKKPL